MEYVSIAFGVLIIAVGLYFLLTPYEKLAAMLPKKKSRRNLRARLDCTGVRRSSDRFADCDDGDALIGWMR